MQIGRFFSLQQGRVGQYLSPRVLVSRAPFNGTRPDACYFGFDERKQAEHFAQSLARLGFTFKLRRSRLMPQAYEIVLKGHCDLARTLAYWDRIDTRRMSPAAGPRPRQPVSTTAAIAA